MQNYIRNLLPVLMGLFTFIAAIILLSPQASTIIHNASNSMTNHSSVQQELNENQQQEDPSITIQHINVHAPVLYDAPDNKESTFQNLLRNGVVHYPQTAKPGRQGNTVIFGHSSGRLLAPGDYKFIFSKLEQLKRDDTILINYEGVLYTYKVDDMRIVSAYDMSVLRQANDHRLTLITCYPVGSNEKRYIVSAHQISPKPTHQTPAQNSPPDDLLMAEKILPGSTPQ